MSSVIKRQGLFKIAPISTLLFALFFVCPGIHAASLFVDHLVPDEIRADATFDHIGVRWNLQGNSDQNQNSTLKLEFRKKGQGAWQSGAQGMRAYPSTRVGNPPTPLGLNYWAASALFLESGKQYELRLILEDPDGGSQTKIITVATRIIPRADPKGRQLKVIPGGGGGDGSSGNPYRGLQAAADAASPGDTFHVASGTYAPFTLHDSHTGDRYITFLGPDSGEAVVDGNNMGRGVVTLEGDAPSHIIIEKLTIKNGGWGVDAQNTHDIVIRNNHILNVGFGIVNRRENGREYNQTVCDNVFNGRTSYPSGDRTNTGIDLLGSGNVVCHNEIRNFGDCVSVEPLKTDTNSNDVFGNDISECADDGIEIDENESNVRVWRNRVMNAKMGVSTQPIRGGPAYIFRNEFFNLENKPIKLHNNPTGLVIMHNTGVQYANGFSDTGTSILRNTILRNNLFLGTEYAFSFVTIADEGFRDLDYNAWGTQRTQPKFKWNTVRYNTLQDLQEQTGIEHHGKNASSGDLQNAQLPGNQKTVVAPGSRDLRLKSGVAEINSGSRIANINDGFSISGAPDMGAFEQGQPLPHYGVRKLPKDMEASPSLHFEILTNGSDADEAPGPTINTGGAVTWSYKMSNKGNVPLSNVRVFERERLSSVTEWQLACRIGTVSPGSTATCSSMSVAQEGQYRREATAQGFVAEKKYSSFKRSYYTGI